MALRARAVTAAQTSSNGVDIATGDLLVGICIELLLGIAGGMLELLTNTALVFAEEGDALSSEKLNVSRKCFPKFCMTYCSDVKFMMEFCAKVSVRDKEFRKTR
jgi:hypothetical protein